MSFKRPTALIALLAIVAALSITACGSKSSSPSTGATGSTGSGSTTTQISAATAKFVLHAGLAFGAFHHFIYEPFKAGDFSHPFSHKFTIVKAGLAGAFIYHEVKLAAADAEASSLLHPLVAPINALIAKVSSLGSQVRSGNTAAVSAINGDISSLSSQASGLGATIKEAVPSIL
jgi:hypothetical protein